MSVHIYNSLTRKKEEFKPINPPQVKIYVCGPTVYDEAHIGHMRSAYIFDVIRRYLTTQGFEVKFVRNVTDVDDKIIDRARRDFPGEDLNQAVSKVSRNYLAAYQKDMQELAIMPPDAEPKASEYIGEMVKFIEGLVKKGAAYQAGGDVYFDIVKAKGYGKLSNQSLERMEIGARVLPHENKHNPLDFALWKRAKENEPSWDSPFGRGRPGWHIECSVMSSDILGDEFDIHGGGLDLIFPHHENEIAQSEAAGRKFARYWLHHGLLTINGQKMSKSLGNFVTVGDFLAKYKNADLLKLFFLSTHYAHPVDYTEEKIEEAKKGYERFLILFQKLDRKFGSRDFTRLPDGSWGNINRFKEEFEKAMDDDFNTPEALGVLFTIVNECNKILDNEQDDRRFMLQYAMKTIFELAGILGLSFKDIPGEKSDTWVTVAITQRELLRQEKKYKEADEIRKMLEEKGVILEDTQDGKTTWRRKL
ncbi:MAG: cysteine--tRNA ligase [Candidatus Omnitrophota bacterium]